MNVTEQNKQITLNLLRVELEKTKGIEISDRLDWLDYCLFIFDENYKELESFSAFSEKPDVAWSSFSNHDYSKHVHGNFVRKLHNFLVSSQSLVEHTRVPMRKWYKKTEFLVTYQDKIDEVFLNDPLTSFISDLRNYCTHKSPIGILTNHQVFPNRRNTTYIHKDSLLSWKERNKKTIEYLKKYENDIPVMEPIEEYRNKVIEFRIWLRKEIERFHGKEIMETKWYFQAIKLVEEGKYEEMLRSGGMKLPLTIA